MFLIVLECSQMGDPRNAKQTPKIRQNMPQYGQKGPKSIKTPPIEEMEQSRLTGVDFVCFVGDILGCGSKMVILIYDTWANPHLIMCICRYLGVFVDFTNTICDFFCDFFGYPGSW